MMDMANGYFTRMIRWFDW